LKLNLSYTTKIDQLIEQWKTFPGHEGLRLFVLKNNFVFVTITNYGLRMVHLLTPDKNEEPVDIIVGPETPEDFFSSSNPYYGAIIGRYANRVDKGRFQLEGEWFQLACNIGEHHLHGGPNGLHNQVWDCIFESNEKLVFSHTSPHLTENYPGTLLIEVSMELIQNSLKINYKATTDKTTIINLTHHPFFNLDGCGTQNFNSHKLQLEADHFLPVRSDVIPEGRFSDVASTSFDFTKPAFITERLNQKHEQLERGHGFDHTFIRRNFFSEEYGLIASVHSDLTGIFMRIHTTEPGVQLYTGNFMVGTNKTKNGGFDVFRSAFCLETQHFPDSPNQPLFPSVVLRPDEEYHSTTSFNFFNQPIITYL
jgi:aldose 1-epimerase